jgi:chorismate dehydratase
MSASVNSPSQSNSRLRVASVIYFNSKPLIEELADDPEIELSLAVPARLIDDLQNGQTDVALLPVIDLLRLEGARIIPAGGIGCDGPTLTVRVFSRVPLDEVTELACDVESHTSVALARVLLAEVYGTRPEFKAYRAGETSEPETILIIGDKVVCDEPQDYPHQMDLGEAWKRLTGLPFVFAVWTARQGVDLRDLPLRLTTAKQTGLRKIDQLVEQYAVPAGWPRELAKKYLTSHLVFDVGPAQLEGIKRFLSLAVKHGATGGPLREIIIAR